MKKTIKIAQYEWMLATVNLGIILLDEEETVVYWNEWMEKKSGIGRGEALGRNFIALFPEVEEGRLGSAVKLALKNAYPSLLSQSLNRAPLPLHESIEARSAATRIQQAIQVIPQVEEDIEGRERKFCLVQVADVTLSVEREKLLWEQAERLRAFSHIDGLTGIPNRRRFDEYIETEFRRAARNRKPLSLILIDVDFFKAYNDNFGHLEGDDCLIRTFNAVKNALHRPADLAARYGGEEMAVVLPETDLTGALNLAEDLRLAVEALMIPHPFSATAPHVTVSLGVACVFGHGTPQSLIELADRELYHAKAAGRNRVYPG